MKMVIFFLSQELQPLNVPLTLMYSRIKNKLYIQFFPWTQIWYLLHILFKLVILMRKFLMLFLNYMCKRPPLFLGMLETIYGHFYPISHNFGPMGRIRNPFSRILVHNYASAILEVWEIVQLDWATGFANRGPIEKRISRWRALAILDFYLHCFYFLSHFVRNFLKHLLCQTALFNGFKIILRADLNFGVLNALTEFLKHFVDLSFLLYTIIHQMLSTHYRGLF